MQCSVLYCQHLDRHILCPGLQSWRIDDHVPDIDSQADIGVGLVENLGGVARLDEECLRLYKSC